MWTNRQSSAAVFSDNLHVLNADGILAQHSHSQVIDSAQRQSFWLHTVMNDGPDKRSNSRRNRIVQQRHAVTEVSPSSRSEWKALYFVRSRWSRQVQPEQTRLTTKL